MDATNEQRKLEREALRNVRGLYEELDSRDAAAQHADRGFLVFMVVTGAVALLALGILTLVQGPEAGAAERARCIQDVQVAELWKFKTHLRDNYPGMSPDEIDKRGEVYFKDMRSIATIECARGYPIER